MVERNAMIENTSLDMGDRGLLTAWIQLDYGDSGHQGFGGYALYLPESYDHHELKSFAGHFIFRSMQVAGANKWEDMKGKTIRVRSEDGLIVSIGHILKDDWFSPKKDYK